MFKNVKIKQKLIVSFLLITFIASISGVLSVFITQNVNREYSYAMKNYGFAQGDVGKVLACFGSINVSVHDAIAYTDLEDQRAAQETYDKQRAKMADYFNAVEATIQREATKKRFDTAKAAWLEYEKISQQLIKEGDSDDVAVVQQAQEKLVDQLDPLYNTVYDNFADIMADKVETGNQLEQDLTADINGSVLFVIGVIITALIVSIIMGTKISSSIANPVHACAKRLRDLAGGDLKSPVPAFNGKDEIGVLAQSTRDIVDGLTNIIADEQYLLEEMANGNFDVYSRNRAQYVGDFTAVIEAIRGINYRLSDALRRINESSEQVSTSSEQVSNASQNLSQGAAEQASSIESLAGTITKISEQVSNNAKNAEVASEKADQVGVEMQRSNEKMNQMILAMKDISNSSNEIGKIIKTIEDIAFQTNILALNAAVEAARAGEAGKGFAVVADEVRNLASKSAEASKNTAQLIEASVSAVENGTQIADETAKTLLVAVDGAKEVVDIVDKISVASAEQSKSVEQVTENVEQISGVVQTNSATAEESAAASEELSNLAQMLKSLVASFRLKEFTGESSPVLPASAYTGAVPEPSAEKY